MTTPTREQVVQLFKRFFSARSTVGVQITEQECFEAGYYRGLDSLQTKVSATELSAVKLIHAMDLSEKNTVIEKLSAKIESLEAENARIRSELEEDKEQTEMNGPSHMGEPVEVARVDGLDHRHVEAFEPYFLLPTGKHNLFTHLLNTKAIEQRVADAFLNALNGKLAHTFGYDCADELKDKWREFL